MIDIFAEVIIPPKLYIADVTLAYEYRARKNSKSIEKCKIKLEKYPIVLSNGKFPSKIIENNFMERVFRAHGKGSYEDSNIRLVSIDNCKFSSKIAYKFNYNTK